MGAWASAPCDNQGARGTVGAAPSAALAVGATMDAAEKCGLALGPT